MVLVEVLSEVCQSTWDGKGRALDVVKLGKVMTSRMRVSRDLQGTIDLQISSCIWKSLHDMLASVFCCEYTVDRMTSCLSV